MAAAAAAKFGCVCLMLGAESDTRWLVRPAISAEPELGLGLVS